MNINNPTSFGIPNLTLSTSNSEGTGNAVRTDATVAVFDANLPDAITFGQSGAAGSAAVASRRDHAHAMASQTTYETGTWTPVLSDGSNNASMHVNTAGQYTRSGRAISISAYVETSSLGSVSGSLRITGLPFSVASGTSFTGTIAGGYGGGFSITAGNYVNAQAQNGTSMATLVLWDVSTGSSAMQSGEWTADGALYLSGTYFN